jgi:hypothetical protein
MTTEKQKIELAINEFSELMNKRMQEKRKRGFTGWTSPIMKRDVENRLQGKLTRVLRGEVSGVEFVDIANLAMILHGFHDK